MIENASQLNASLFQLSSFVDSLDAVQRDCDARKDYRLLPLMSEGLIIRIRELNEEIRAYLKQQPEVVAAGSDRRPR
jgi:hypothetical protein